MFVIKYNLMQDRDVKYYLVDGGITLNWGKEDVFISWEMLNQ